MENKFEIIGDNYCELQQDKDFLPYESDFTDYMFDYVDKGGQIFEVGDEVEFKYPYNLDGYSTEQRLAIRDLIGRKGKITSMVLFNDKTQDEIDNPKFYTIYNEVREEEYRPIIDFGNEQINFINNWYRFHQLQFILAR